MEQTWLAAADMRASAAGQRRTSGNDTRLNFEQTGLNDVLWPRNVVKRDIAMREVCPSVSRTRDA